MENKKSSQKGTKSTLQSATLSKKPAAERAGSGVEFRLDAPMARNVNVAGSFNGWDTQALKLKRDFYGVWRVSANLKPGRYQYRFLVDGNWMDDPKAKVTQDNGFGGKNAILEVK